MANSSAPTDAHLVDAVIYMAILSYLDAATSFTIPRSMLFATVPGWRQLETPAKTIAFLEEDPTG
jgi:hypothetical protein